MQMYIFEFNHTLDHKDLVNIWQGVMPKISKQAEKQVSSITHFLTNNELLLGREINDNVRWMVFKVKQRANYNFMEMRRKSTYGGFYKYSQEQEQFINELDTGTGPYSYNWPYDFFSLVELAKIDVGVQIGGTVPITPADITVEPVQQGEDPPKKKDPDLAKDKGLSPANVKKAYIQQGDKDSGQTQEEIEQEFNELGNDPIF